MLISIVFICCLNIFSSQSRQISLEWEIRNNDIFENGTPFFIATVNSNTCPSVVYIDKFVHQSWHEACVLRNDNSYDCSKLPDESSLQGRGKLRHRFINNNQEYTFVIQTVSFEDNGLWRFTVKECIAEDVSSNHEELTISTNLTAANLTVTSPPYILLNRTTNFVCSSDRVYPEANVTWNPPGDHINGKSKNIFDGTFWRIENSNNFTFCDRNDIIVSCTLEKTWGNTWNVTESAWDIPTYAPATVEFAKISNSNPNISDTLRITCTGSGTNHWIEWEKDGYPLPDGLFDRNDEVIEDDFACGETNATRSTLTWIKTSDWTCDTVGTHDGKYQCIVKANKETVDTSDIFKMDVYYPPVLESTAKCIETSVGKYENLLCKEKCAMPDEVSYTWKSDNNPEGLDYNTSSITIEITVDDINNTYTCTVSNQVGSNSMRFTIRQEESPGEASTTDQPPDTTTLFDNGTTTGSEEPESPNQALVTAFAVIWSLCGVFAILLVCLALYHYRQIQNGKEYKGEYSEELVLTKDEAQPGTSHCFGVYDDISPAVVGKGSVSGAVGGVTNEGLYAEVQTPEHTKMPVAPKRTSKVPASQANPGTPKTKRTQAPPAPKSPVNTRHQPNSPCAGRHHEPKADYSPVSKINEIQTQHSNESKRGPASKTEQHQKRHESPNSTVAVKQTTNGAKPTIPFKPNITSVRSSRSSAAGAPYDNAEVNLYANCDQRPIQKNDDGTITYADLALQQEDPYDEGAPPVPAKNINDQEPVQYASIKQGK